MEKKLYNKIISLSGKNSDAWNNLGWLYYKKEDYVKAIEYLNYALTLDRENEQAWDMLNRIYSNIKDNIGNLTNVNLSFFLELKRNQSWYYLKLAKFLFSINKYKDASQACEKSLNYDPKKKSALKLKQKLITNQT